MKIEHLIVQHLYNNKKVTLQDIGSFFLSPDVSMPSESDKDGVMPDNAITFEYNTKATEDTSLVEFIVQQTRKIKPLAKSDLESYSILGREYLNIGKPFVIEGLGTLQKNQSGHYDFAQSHSVNPRLQAAPPLLREKDNEEIVFTTPVRKPTNNKGGMILVALLFLLAFAAILIYFLNKKEVAQPVASTLDTSVVKEDTALTMRNLAHTVQSSQGNKNFKIVIKEYKSKMEADKAHSKLTNYGHKLEMYQKDSSTYRIAMSFNLPFSDTTKLRDSLNRFFGGKSFVELN